MLVFLGEVGFIKAAYMCFAKRLVMYMYMYMYICFTRLTCLFFASIVLKRLSNLHVHVTTTVNLKGTAIGKLPFVVIFTSTFYC